MDENLFRYAPLRQKRRSGFDKSFSNFLTAKVGTLVPVLCDEVIPNTDVNIRVAAQAQLPPLASDVFMRCDLKMEAFFCPSRILYGGYDAWLTGSKVRTVNGDEEAALPFVKLSSSHPELLAPGSLADYLGYKNRGVSVDSVLGIQDKLNAFPFLCYHRIYDDWYRNTLVQTRLFNRPAAGSGGVSAYAPQFTPYSTIGVSDAQNGFDLYTSIFGNGHRFGQLHQRNYGMDYFTAATPLPQKGDAQKVTIDTGDDSSSFTIASLRANNSMQMFLERNNLIGERLQDFVAGHYGAHMPDSIAQRAVLLGSASFDIYSKGVETNATFRSPSEEIVNQNPFAGIAGNVVGSARAEGSDFIINGFKAQEPGYIMIIASVVPQANYSTGIDRMLLRYTEPGSQVDLANPLLENVGPQPIYASEILADASKDDIFGYIDRYADFKTKLNQVHGLFVDGSDSGDGTNLSAFVLQRPFFSADTEQPQVNDGFLQILESDMDNVTALASDLSLFGAMIDCYFDYKAVMPLARYSVPSLESPMDGDFEVVQRSGSKIS